MNKEAARHIDDLRSMVLGRLHVNSFMVPELQSLYRQMVSAVSDCKIIFLAEETSKVLEALGDVPVGFPIRTEGEWVLYMTPSYPKALGAEYMGFVARHDTISRRAAYRILKKDKAIELFLADISIKWPVHSIPVIWFTDSCQLTQTCWFSRQDMIFREEPMLWVEGQDEEVLEARGKLRSMALRCMDYAHTHRSVNV